MMEQMNDLSAAIQQTLATLQMKHQNILSISPLMELNNYINKLASRFEEFRLPSLPDPKDIFTFATPTKQLDTDLVSVNFKIPLVYSENYTQYAFVSAPSVEREVIALDNGQLVQISAISHDNQTGFTIDAKHRLNDNF